MGQNFSSRARDLLELSGFAVFAHFSGFKDPSVHGEIDAVWLALEGSDGSADVEDGVGDPEAGGSHRSGQDDDFPGKICEGFGSLGHGVGAVGDEDLTMGGVLTGLANFEAVLVGDFQAVLTEEGNQFVINVGSHVFENVGDDGVSNFELRCGIEVDLIDGAAGGQDEHDEGRLLVHRNGIGGEDFFAFPDDFLGCGVVGEDPGGTAFGGFATDFWNPFLWAATTSLYPG